MYRYILTALIVLILLPGQGFGEDAGYSDSLRAGNTYYLAEDYEKAIAAYETVLEAGYEAPELYYNLGNSYFKQSSITYAILNYERALLLDPSNENVIYNLELARAYTVDRIEPVPGFVLSEWHKALVNLMSTNAWAITSLITFFVFLLSVSLYLYLRSYGAKKLFFWFAFLFLYLSVSSLVFSLHHRKMTINPGTALIAAPSVTVESSPDKSGTDLFLLHEGTKVVVKEQIGDWSNIRVADGNQGWVLTDLLMMI